MITASLSPNTEFDDVLASAKTLSMPWLWKDGDAILSVEKWFCSYFNAKTAVAFSSGRMAQRAILESFSIGKGDDVLVQAFTCVAVPNSVLWAGAKPVFVDIDATGNIDVDDAEKKLTPKTKAMIVQHTFGIPADIKAIVSFCTLHKLILIEDCSHSLGIRVDGKLLGMFGDAAFFSFGRDKVISSVWGGVAIINSVRVKESKRLSMHRDALRFPSYAFILKQLTHPLLFFFSMPLYRIGVGKVFIAFFRALSLLSLPIFPIELTGGIPKELVTRYPNALALLILHQLEKLDLYTRMRSETAKGYKTIISKSNKIHTFETPFGATYLRFPLLVSDPSVLIRDAKKDGILLGNWYSNVIDPKGVSFELIGYRKGSCPKAEKASKHILNVPTRLTRRERMRVYSFLSRHV